MILSDIDIQQAIAHGTILIDPFDLGQLNPASYCLHLGDRLLIPKGTIEIDAADPKLEFDEITIGPDGYVIAPGEFLLGSVFESISIATSVAARLDARTTLARIGLDVLQGSTLVEPGQSNSHETLEIRNCSKRMIRIRNKMKIVKVVFDQLASPASRAYSGVYSGQNNGRVK